MNLNYKKLDIFYLDYINRVVGLKARLFYIYLRVFVEITYCDLKVAYYYIFWYI